jgi:uncharacterized RDD family membrane protein YckC
MNETTAEPRRIRSLVTPEGVDLKLRVAEAGERAAAFLIDAMILAAALIALTLLALFAFGAWAARQRGGEPEIIAIVWLLGAFLLRNAWFIAFELGPRAATPGKRVLGLRVAARSGGALTAEAVFARNALREIEVWLPLSFLLSRGGGVDGWIVLAGLVWTGVFVFFPLFNRDRLRAGDLVAGTWVVKAPKARLLRDLSGDAAPSGFAFSAAQVQAYGVKELHVLEQVLRAQDRKVQAAVAERIRAKIGWAPAPQESDHAFLAAYYAALRARLEHRLLFGHRRKDKFDAA